MQAARVQPDGSLALESVARPSIGPGEVLVEVEACGICGSDLHAARRRSWPSGLIPGHEVAGKVAALGSEAKQAGDGGSLEIGRSVVVEPLETCEGCAACLAGRDSQCPGLRIAGVHRAGGFAQFMVAPARRVYPVDDRIAPATATLAEPLAVALHALDRGELEAGQRVLVIGAGPIGLLCAFAASEAGAAEVVVRARYAHQARSALRLGASSTSQSDETIESAGLTSRFDLILETVGGASHSLVEAGRAARPGGRIVVLGLFDEAPALEPFVALEKELSLHWSNCYHATPGRQADFCRATAALALHHERLRELVSRALPLPEIAEAFRLAGQKRTGLCKLVVVASVPTEASPDC